MLLDGKNIFLLEDDPVNYSVILTILRQQGATTTLDHWGDRSLRRLLLLHSLEDIDLIILDLMLPGDTSGYDVYDAIKEKPQLSHIPVIVVSAADPDVEIPKVKAKGMQGFIGKPIDRRDFPAKLAQIIEGEQIWGD